jgi:hypothetical protein
MKRNLLLKHCINALHFLPLFFVFSLFVGLETVQGQCKLLNESFSLSPVLAATNTDGAWYPDRYPPAGFSSAVLNGENVLKISIDGTADGAVARGGGYTSTFYNTQGRKFNQCGGCVTVMKGDLWIPADWQSNHRRSDMWATGFDGSNNVQVYPIIGFRNPDGSSAGIYFWNENVGWVNSGVTITYNKWYSLEFRLVGSDVQFFVNGTNVGIVPANGATYFGDVMLQAYNFNDPALPLVNQSSDSYDSFWDNVKTTGTGGNVVTNVNTGISYCSIQSAINDPLTLNGHTIQASAGTYHEAVLVNKQLTIKGAKAGTLAKGRGGDESIVDPPLAESHGFKIISDNVTIDGFTITNSNAYPASERYGVITIEEMNSDRFTAINVKNNVITRQFKAVDFNYTDNFEISGNWLHGEGDSYNYGATWIDDYGTSSNNGLIKNNDMDGYGSAIEIQGDLTHPVSNVTITENRSVGSQYVLFGLQNSNVYRNSVLNVISGTHVFVGGGNKDDKFEENFFDNGTSNGVSISDNFGAGKNSNLTFNKNSITGHNNPGKYEIIVNPSAYSGTLDATCNWYGTINSDVIASKISGPVSFKPYLTNGTDNNLAAPGFQNNSCNGYQYIDCGKKDDKKVTVCHNGKAQCISVNALQEHLSHGDILGSCSAQPITQAAPIDMTQALLSVSKLAVYPNPSFGQFTLQLNNLKASKAQIVLMDQNGRTIEQRSIQLINGQQSVIYNTRKFASGMYIVKVISEDGVQTSKVMIH